MLSILFMYFLFVGQERGRGGGGGGGSEGAHRLIHWRQVHTMIYVSLIMGFKH